MQTNSESSVQNDYECDSSMILYDPVEEDDTVTAHETIAKHDAITDYDSIENQKSNENPSNKTIYNMLKVIDNKLDYLISLHSAGGPSCMPSCAPNDQPLVEPFTFVRIKDQNDLISFEKKLNDENYKKKLLNLFADTFQSMDKFQKSNRRFAYKAIYMFAKRRLFSLYSWTGKARNGQKNMSLEKHTVFLNFIHGAIKRKLPNFKFSELENIFQSLCRNKNAKNAFDSSGSD